MLPVTLEMKGIFGAERAASATIRRNSRSISSIIQVWNACEVVSF